MFYSTVNSRFLQDRSSLSIASLYRLDLHQAAWPTQSVVGKPTAGVMRTCRRPSIMTQVATEENMELKGAKRNEPECRVDPPCVVPVGAGAAVRGLWGHPPAHLGAGRTAHGCCAAGGIVFDSDRRGLPEPLRHGFQGGSVVRLTTDETNDFAGPWSPDGKRIAYTWFDLTTSDVWVMNADGTGRTNLTNSPQIDEGFPAWSPDGQRIAFTTLRDGNNEIYVMGADGTACPCA